MYILPNGIRDLQSIYCSLHFLYKIYTCEEKEARLTAFEPLFDVRVTVHH